MHNNGAPVTPWQLLSDNCPETIASSANENIAVRDCDGEI